MRSAHACRRCDPPAFSWGRFWQGRHLVQLTGGAANFDLAATSVKHLFELLAERLNRCALPRHQRFVSLRMGEQEAP